MADSTGPEISGSFSFNLKMNRPTPPNGLALVNRVLKLRAFPATAEELLSTIVSMVNGGKGDRDFRKWLDESGGGYQREYADVLFHTIMFEIYGNEPRGLSLSSGPPYWMLTCGSIYCAAHNHLDGLVRRADSPLWKDIYPPNGWACGCGVLIVEPEEARTAKRIKVSAETLAACRNWMETDPFLVVTPSL